MSTMNFCTYILLSILLSTSIQADNLRRGSLSDDFAQCEQQLVNIDDLLTAKFKKIVEEVGRVRENLINAREECDESCSAAEDLSVNRMDAVIRKFDRRADELDKILTDGVARVRDKVTEIANSDTTVVNSTISDLQISLNNISQTIASQGALTDQTLTTVQNQLVNSLNQVTRNLVQQVITDACPCGRIQTEFGTLNTNLGRQVQRLVNTTQPLISRIQSTLNTLLESSISGFTMIINSLSSIQASCTQFSTDLSNLLNTGFNNTLTSFMNLQTATNDGFTTLLTAIADAFAQIAKLAADIATAQLAIFTNLINGFLQTIAAIVASIPTTISDLATAITTAVTMLFNQIFTTLVMTLDAGLTQISTAAMNCPPAVV